MRTRKPPIQVKCEVCGRNLFFYQRGDGRPNPTMHNICYHEKRKQTPSQYGYILLEYLYGFDVPIQPIEIQRDLGFSRSGIQKPLYKLLDLNLATRTYDGYQITIKGINTLMKHKENVKL